MLQYYVGAGISAVGYFCSAISDLYAHTFLCNNHCQSGFLQKREAGPSKGRQSSTMLLMLLVYRARATLSSRQSQGTRNKEHDTALELEIPRQQNPKRKHLCEEEAPNVE